MKTYRLKKGKFLDCAIEEVGLLSVEIYPNGLTIVADNSHGEIVEILETYNISYTIEALNKN